MVLGALCALSLSACATGHYDPYAQELDAPRVRGMQFVTSYEHLTSQGQIREIARTTNDWCDDAMSAPPWRFYDQGLRCVAEFEVIFVIDDEIDPVAASQAIDNFLRTQNLSFSPLSAYVRDDPGVVETRGRFVETGAQFDYGSVEVTFGRTDSKLLATQIGQRFHAQPLSNEGTMTDETSADVRRSGAKFFMSLDASVEYYNTERG